MTSTIHLQAKDLEYGRGSPLTRPLSFSMKAGTTTALLGVNGRGKTTLLETLAGMIPPISGVVKKSGVVGYVPQRFRADLPYDAVDIVLLGRARRIGTFSLPSRRDEEAARSAMDLLGISRFADRRFSSLSGGEQQLVMIARALAAGTDAIILDEPAAALDLGRQELLLSLMRRLADELKMSVLFSTHDPLHASACADQVLLLMPDLEFKVGSPDEVLNLEDLKKVYGVDLMEASSRHSNARILAADFRLSAVDS